MIHRLSIARIFMFQPSVFLLACAATALSGTVSTAQTVPQIASLAAPEHGGPRRLEVIDSDVGLYREPSENSEQLSLLAQSTLLANRGCAEVGGQVWCEVAERDGARTGYVVSHHVVPATGPDGVVATGRDDSKVRARRRDYDASGEIACAQNEGESLGQCKAGVARSGGGDATVIATFSNSFTRELYFTHGEFTRGNSTMSGVGTDTDWRFEDGLYVIRVDDQRYEIPKAFVLGE